MRAANGWAGQTGGTFRVPRLGKERKEERGRRPKVEERGDAMLEKVQHREHNHHIGAMRGRSSEGCVTGSGAPKVEYRF